MRRCIIPEGHCKRYAENILHKLTGPDIDDGNTALLTWSCRSMCWWVCMRWPCCDWFWWMDLYGWWCVSLERVCVFALLLVHMRLTQQFVCFGLSWFVEVMTSDCFPLDKFRTLFFRSFSSHPSFRRASSGHRCPSGLGAVGSRDCTLALGRDRVRHCTWGLLTSLLWLWRLPCYWFVLNKGCILSVWVVPSPLTCCRFVFAGSFFLARCLFCFCSVSVCQLDIFSCRWLIYSPFNPSFFLLLIAFDWPSGSHASRVQSSLALCD